MPFIIEEYGSYIDYLNYFGNTSNRKYIIKLINNTTSTPQVVKNSPIGMTALGLHYERHELYEGIFPSIILKLTFKNQSGYGGDFIKSEYESKGVKGNMSIYVYKKNESNNDFDIIYTGKLDFSDESYEYNAKENTISVNFNPVSKLNKLLSRDEIEVNMRGGKSIEGNSISDFTNENRTIVFTPIDIAFQNNLTGNINISQPITGNNTYTSGFIANIEILYNQSGNRIKPTASTRSNIFYTNDTGESRNVHVDVTGSYYIKNDFLPTVILNNSMTIRVRGRLYKGLSSHDLFDITDNHVNIAVNTTDIHTDDINTSADFVVADGESIYLELVLTITNTFNMTGYCDTTIGQHTITSDLTEYSPGEPSTNVRCYHMHEAITRLDQILTDETIDSQLIYSSIYGRTNSEKRTYGSNGAGAYDSLTNGWQCRNLTNKSFVTTFRRVFKTCKNTRNVGMGFDSTNNRFYIEDLEQFYQDTLVLDFGEVDIINVTPIRHPSTIRGGYDVSGNYDDFSGAYEINLKTNYGLSFESKETIDMTIPLRGDSLAIELMRRKPAFSLVTEDTEWDSDVFFISTNGTRVLVGADYAATGFPSVSDYYNIGFTPRECLVRCQSRLNPFVWKTNEELKFLNNTKDVNAAYNSISYGGTNHEKNDIQTTYAPKPYWHPEKYAIETNISNSDLNTIISNLYGYFKCSDKHGNNYYFYIKSFDSGAEEKSIKIEGVRANINRS